LLSLLQERHHIKEAEWEAGIKRYTLTEQGKSFIERTETEEELQEHFRDFGSGLCFRDQPSLSSIQKGALELQRAIRDLVLDACWNVFNHANRRNMGITMDEIVQTFNLTKKFDGNVAVDHINFSVHKGEIFGLLGPNGAGKSTTIKMLCTLLRPTEGTAIVAGYDIVEKPDEVRKHIGLSQQETVLDVDLSAYENLELRAKLYGISKEERKERIWKLLEIIGLQDQARDQVKTYSSGMRRRLQIIRAFVHRPELLILDEPTLGLDTQTRRAIWDHIRYLNKEEGITIMLTTHYLEEADYLCNRVGIIDFGKIVVLDSPINLKNFIGNDVIEASLSSVNEGIIAAFQGLDGVHKVIAGENDMRLYVAKGEEIMPRIIEIANARNIKVQSISMHKPSLEDVFIHYTGRRIREEAGSGSGRMAMMMKRRQRGA
jgi:ABC-2 type transport system ATP-binding protein